MGITETRKSMKGLKWWWNRNCKPQYKITISAKELENECLSEMMNTGSVEMRAFYSKDDCTKNWRG